MWSFKPCVWIYPFKFLYLLHVSTRKLDDVIFVKVKKEEKIQIYYLQDSKGIKHHHHIYLMHQRIFVAWDFACKETQKSKSKRNKKLQFIGKKCNILNELSAKNQIALLPNKWNRWNDKKLLNVVKPRQLGLNKLQNQNKFRELLDTKKATQKWINQWILQR